WAWVTPPIPISILDWPEQIQTSPTRTFLTVTFSGPDTDRVYGPPAENGPRCAIHFPSASAVAFPLLPFMLTIACLPGMVQRHTVAERFLCSTMLSVNRA